MKFPNINILQLHVLDDYKLVDKGQQIYLPTYRFQQLHIFQKVRDQPPKILHVSILSFFFSHVQ